MIMSLADATDHACRTDARSAVCIYPPMTGIDDEIAINYKPLSVDVVDGEIVLDGFGSAAPSLTPGAARETARRLIEAADKLQLH
ncbi:MAG: hypothetical protein ACRYG4_14145 [Janthinobacterium lividum]